MNTGSEPSEVAISLLEHTAEDSSASFLKRSGPLELQPATKRRKTAQEISGDVENDWEPIPFDFESISE
ncbi:hypothetical protein PGT21_018471 [Puccinia graminis f. sp. tritici]|uniref:Uncharacterized protein n=1 Tax=Puccinia graminis f. sp. tritici TaxID=56615 RepID=A0A5B0NJ60_PUCGR|nr:hypothetical protein PGT21_023331 [Puccinia graminis f. sp. tritici]KAA1070763.1 hypothetical protein PGT21_023483 [Puccinia graminis f. sp. tritici]KAA1088564.1 hypothetical protein PGT21_000551 [Puccinia graminis f. sp. tritici]KAA1103453.1 hypothetical protein PGT21_018471 [Puccinia graminis f. sp. tritici]KAA1125716.1 hypothetical protein PGTUg99_005201 [Puccinia graminis f. sp. tritici]